MMKKNLFLSYVGKEYHTFLIQPSVKGYSAQFCWLYSTVQPSLVKLWLVLDFLVAASYHIKAEWNVQFVAEIHFSNDGIYLASVESQKAEEAFCLISKGGASTGCTGHLAFLVQEKEEEFISSLARAGCLLPGCPFIPIQLYHSRVSEWMKRLLKYLWRQSNSKHFV